MGIFACVAGIILILLNGWLAEKTADFHDNRPHLGFSGVLRGTAGRFVFIIFGCLAIAFGVLMIIL